MTQHLEIWNGSLQSIGVTQLLMVSNMPGGKGNHLSRVDGLFHQTLATAGFLIITPISFLKDKASPSLVAQSSLPI